MTNAELIKALQELPGDAEVKGVYDGAARIDVGAVWLSREGCVLLADEDAYLYYEEDFPAGEMPPKIQLRP